MNEVIRIIGGKYRGKQIHFPALPHLRPTPNRIRETLFNWLMHDIRGAYCLDAFAGSGALGFEAFSRGAQEVVFLESEWITYQQLLKTAQSFKTSALNILHCNALPYLQETDKMFDIIFLDPPFTMNYLENCLEVIQYSALLKPQGLVYSESDFKLDLDSAQWEEIKAKKAGQVYYSLLRKKV